MILKKSESNPAEAGPFLQRTEPACLAKNTWSTCQFYAHVRTSGHHCITLSRTTSSLTFKRSQKWTVRSQRWQKGRSSYFRPGLFKQSVCDTILVCAVGRQGGVFLTEAFSSGRHLTRVNTGRKGCKKNTQSTSWASGCLPKRWVLEIVCRALIRKN